MAYDRNDRRGGRKGRRKVCSFCVDKVETIDYKDVPRLRKFISDRSKILPRRVTGTCAAHQRELTNRYQAGSSRSFATVYERLIRDQNCLHEAPAFGVAPLFIWRKANTEKKSPPAASQPGALLFFLRDSIAGWAVPYPPLPVPGALPPVSAAPPGAPQAPAPDETMHQGRAQA